MKRWIHAATSFKLTEEQAADLAEDFIEDLGFVNVRKLQSRNGIGVVTVPFQTISPDDPEVTMPYMKHNFKDFENFKTAQELYIGQYISTNGSDMSRTLKEIAAKMSHDIEEMFKQQGHKLEVEFSCSPGTVYEYLCDITIYIRTTPFYKMKRPAGAH